MPQQRPFPQPEIFSPGSGEPSLRWGVIGAGWISGQFVDALREHTSQQVVAVATRSRATAGPFAQAQGIERAYSSVSELLDDREVDVVYIATPQELHVSVGLEAIAAGKHVLIEKPIATDAKEAARLVSAASRAGVLLMEAMWTRYLPQTQVIRALLDDGALGDPRSVFADHGQATAADNRLRRGGRAGGALLDLGVYSVQLASLALGPATEVSISGTATDAGVDATTTLILQHEGGTTATITTSLETQTPTVASINGSAARIELPGPFYFPVGFTLRTNDWWDQPQTWVDESGVSLFGALSWQATALACYVKDGRTESPLHTHAETVRIIETIDRARIALGTFA